MEPTYFSDRLGYPVFVDAGWQALEDFLSERWAGKKLFVLCDENTERHCLPLLDRGGVTVLKQSEVLEVEPGEPTKSVEVVAQLWHALVELGADRHSVVINLGGGVVSDLGGFVAATLKRGISFVQVPTTLLSMVDASVGGKTGINLGGIKNQVGTFSTPEAVFIFPVFLETLSERELRSGWAEVIKHEVLSGAAPWEQESLHELQVSGNWAACIERSVRFKAKIVASDLHEKGLRQVLNFGHTMGHALETWSRSEGQESLLHGEAIAAGMVMEMHLSHQLLGFPEADLGRFANYVLDLYGKVAFEGSEKTLLEIMDHDKKNSGNTRKFALLKTMGNPVIGQAATSELVRESMTYYQSLTVA